jgi:hypothetical protein
VLVHFPEGTLEEEAHQACVCSDDGGGKGSCGALAPARRI